MALDGKHRDIAQQLATEASLRDSLGKDRNTPAARKRIFAWLDDETVADPRHYDAIIAEAADLIGAPAPAQTTAGATKQRVASLSKSKPERYGKDETPPDPKNASAPYRFITIADEVVLADEAEGKRSITDPLPDGYCGTIEVEWIAETPILIGGAAHARESGANGEVFPLEIGGKPVIPGSTFRGLVRSDLEIVAFAKLTQANLHHRYPLRDFMHPNFRISGKAGSVISAGFLSLRKPTAAEEATKTLPGTVVTSSGYVWEIRPAAKWGLLDIATLVPFVISDDFTPDRSENLTEEDIKNREISRWCAFDVSKKYELLQLKDAGRPLTYRKWRVSFQRLNKAQDSIYRAISRDIDGQGEIAVLAFGGPLENGNKKTEAVVFPDDRVEAVAIPAEKVKLFERLHSKPSDTEVLTPEGPWATFREVLFNGVDSRPVEERTVPVFFRGNLNMPGSAGFSFGMTRMFKVPHQFSVGEKLLATQAAHKPRAATKKNADGADVLSAYENVDFVERLFGHVMEPKQFPDHARQPSMDPAALALKGRVAFGFGAITSGVVRTEPAKVSAIQMAPRASFAPFYLRSAPRAAKDWSDKNARLAGRKAYLPRYASSRYHPEAVAEFEAFYEDQVEIVKDANKDGSGPKPDVISDLHFLVPEDNDQPLTFKSEIEVFNVSAAELGAMLFALTHGGDPQKTYRHMIGRGKAFGAGQIRIGRINLDIVPNDPRNDSVSRDPRPGERFDTATGEGWIDEDDGRSITAFIDRFVERMRQDIPDFPNVAPVREWRAMADPRNAAPGKLGRRLGYRPYVLPSQDAAVDAGRSVASGSTTAKATSPATWSDT